ncbi:uncharacterized protein LOC124861165 [Girardinichthys multiradiatus]|uniref:uncharacterized protein LOC124861165 n=1 Tax=Girardinichthys multiradiatus TaxID=208333 RepID=UPI001FAC7A48|nr:uncharacterized protein LOC124861165 [Girardinichthys multiradiatus]
MGLTKCALTGLVFVMTQESELWYRTTKWDESFLQPAGKIPAGPLYDINCSDKESVSSTSHTVFISNSHVLTPVLSIEGLLSVVHISNDGLGILEPLKITDTHVVKVSDLSPFGLVWDYIKRFVKRKDPVASQVLLYLGPQNPRAQTQKLYVFLLPRNISEQEINSDLKDCTYVRSVYSCKLIKDQRYTLSCPRASQDYRIQPKKAEFDLLFGVQYHPTFEIRLPISTVEVAITVQDEKHVVVWEYVVDLNDQSQSDVPSGARVRSERSNLKINLLKILDDLNEGNFNRFKWILKTYNIPINEKEKRENVVDRIVQRYSSEGAVEVMKEILEHIKRNDLVETLS